MSSEETPKGNPEPGAGSVTPEPTPPQPQVSYQQTVDDPYGYGYDPYARDDGAYASPSPSDSTTGPAQAGSPVESTAVVPATPPPPPPSSPVADSDEDEDDDGMLRMSFMEHLDELRSRIFRIIGGLGVGFAVAMYFAEELWALVRAPVMRALIATGQKPEIVQTKPVDAFLTVYVYLPLVAALFLASPWVLYQIWAFISPGLYKRERRWAGPFVVVSAGLFIAGGLFAYTIAFPFALEFLIGIGKRFGFQALLAGGEYFELFVNVVLGVGLLFELPVIVFLLQLIGIATPGFLIRNSRYAVLIIVIIAAIITPTPDAVNLAIFSAPMIVLYFVGVFAGWILTLHREGRRGIVLTIMLLGLVAVMSVLVGVTVAVMKYGYHLTSSWPFLVK